MLFILILMGVAGLLVAVFALRADSRESSSPEKATMNQPPASTPSAPPAKSSPPDGPKKNPLSTLMQMFQKKK